jgi:hypothetical protein
VLGWQIIRRVVSGATGLGPTDVVTGQLQHRRRRTVILGESILTVVLEGSRVAARAVPGWQSGSQDVAENKVASVFRWKASAGAVRESQACH